MSKKTVQAGDSFSQTIIVQPNQTAHALGSGELEVFATPAMIAIMENTAMKIFSENIDEGSSTVGTEIHAKHLKASLVGETITVIATVRKVQEKSVDFEITASNSAGICIGTATHTRVFINKQRFLAKLK